MMPVKTDSFPSTPTPAPVTLEMVITELRVLDTHERLLGLYELGIDGCTARDFGQVTTVLNELITTLDFTQYREIAEGFYRVYAYCLTRATDGAFDQIAFVLQDLRAALAEASTEHHEPAATHTASA
jgi:hypothetical protein